MSVSMRAILTRPSTMLGFVLLADLADASRAVASTSKRNEKVGLLAGVLRRLSPDEIVPAVGVLVGEPRQGRIGVGWRTIVAVDVAPAASPSLEVLELDRALDVLAAAAGAGSVATRQRVLADLLGRATDAEQELVRRLLTGELRQGALAGLMADAVAKASGLPLASVRRAAMLGGDLGRAARAALTGGEAALHEIGLTVLHPVQPMLAAPSATVAEAIAATGPASVEWKLDGARIQVHRAGDDVRIFTRNLNDITSRLPSVAAAVRSLPGSDLVLDGEAIGLDEDGAPHRFQDTMSRFGAEREGAAAGLQAFFFDVLRADGADLIDLTLGERLGVLDELAGAYRIPSIETRDAAAAEAFAADALAAGHEGVMVKALDSRYEAGRRGAPWRKVKPVRTLDLVVLAAEWGHGRRRGWLSNLHLGARNAADNSFVMVGKTFKGLTDALLTWQTERLQSLAIGEDRSSEAYVVHVRPELVVEIALDGVQSSTRYPGGVALRFARVRRYREDKRPDEADTIETVQGMLSPG
jgi:DNA ligase-1